MRRNKVKKLIIIPAYNESANIEKTVASIKKDAKGFDYVIINDCSVDNTRKICEDNGFNIVNLPINLGIGGAVQTGYRYAYEHGYDVAVQVDGDGQHDPEFLDTMAVYLVDHNLDMVIGSRFIEKKGFQSSYTRRMGIRFFTGLIKLMTGKTITDPTSGLRMIGRNAMGLFAYDYPRDYPEPESVVAILRRNMKVEEIPVVMKAREGGVSSISLKKSVYYMIKVPLAILIERIRKLQIIIAIILIIALCVIVNMIRKKRLELRYALAWLIVGVGTLVLDCFPILTTKLAELIGVASPINMLFFLGFCFSLVIIFVLTVAISRVSIRMKQLTQELALYEKKMNDELKNR